MKAEMKRLKHLFVKVLNDVKNQFNDWSSINFRMGNYGGSKLWFLCDAKTHTAMLINIPDIKSNVRRL